MRRFAYVRITDDYVLNYFIFKRLTIYVMFDFAGKVYDPKMHQVQRQKEPGREKYPPIVFNEKNCLGKKICVCLIVLSLDKCSFFVKYVFGGIFCLS